MILRLWIAVVFVSLMIICNLRQVVIISSCSILMTYVNVMYLFRMSFLNIPAPDG